MFGAVILAAIRQKSAIKSIQSGTATGSGTININAVNVLKTMVLSVSKGSAGYVAARGNVSLTPSGGAVVRQGESSGTETGSFPSYSGSISGGTTDLTVKEFSAKLTGSTTLTCDGAVEWQVIEYA